MWDASTASRSLLAAIGGAAMATGLFTDTAAADTIFLSTQLRPIEEATKVRNEILAGVKTPVEYVVEEPPQFAVRMEAERQAGKGTISLVGALHGELAPLVPKGTLKTLDDLSARLSDRGIPDDLMKLGKLGTEHQHYIPWMQATYVMVANKEALPFLPEGANVDTLTYAQLTEWGRRIAAGTGRRKIGFPAGPTGLMPRFFQGYFYPSFTGGVVRPFKSAAAAAAWQALKDLWAFTTPSSLSFGFMQEPLLSTEVWIAWDHLARVKEAISLEPDRFVVFPAPAGPNGRGYMPVIAGLAIPVAGPDPAGAEAVIEHLTLPETQILTAQEVGFFPVGKATLPDDLDPAVEALSRAIATTQNAPDALVSLLPVGLGGKGGEFNKIFMDAFQRIIIRDEPIEEVLGEEAEKLQALMIKTGAGCWVPDAESQGACPVE